MAGQPPADGGGCEHSDCSRHYFFCRPSTSRTPPVILYRYSYRKSTTTDDTYCRCSHNRSHCNPLNPESHSSLTKRLPVDSRLDQLKYGIIRSCLPSCNPLSYGSTSSDDLTYRRTLNRLPYDVTDDGSHDGLSVTVKSTRKRKCRWKRSSLTTKSPTTKCRVGWLLIFLILTLLAVCGAAAPQPPTVALSDRRAFGGGPPQIRPENDFVNERLEYARHYGSRRKRHTNTINHSDAANPTIDDSTIRAKTNAIKTTNNDALTTNGIDSVAFILPSMDDRASETVVNQPITVDDQNDSRMAGATIKILWTADKNVEEKIKIKNNNNNVDDNNNEVVQFSRWVALDGGDFTPLSDGRVGETLEIDSNRTRRIRLKCRVLPRIDEPTLAGVEWRRVGDDVTLIDTAGHETILELNVTAIFKSEDYRCVAIFKPSNYQTVRTTPTDDPQTSESEGNDEDSPETPPPPLVTTSRAVKLRVHSKLHVVASQPIEWARSGDVASLACRRDGGVKTKQTGSANWRWSRDGAGRSLSDGDDEGAIRIYSTAFESKLHILRVDADAHAGGYRCRWSLGVDGAGDATVQLRVDDDDAPLRPPTSDGELTRVVLRTGGEQLLECLHAGAVHVRWLRAANESEMDALLRLDAEDAASGRTLVGEGSALRVDARQIAAAAGAGGGDAAVAEFACVATDSHGRRLLTRKFAVVVQDDLLDEKDSFVTVSRGVGMPAKFECRTYRGERIHTVGWLREGRRFEGHTRAKITWLATPDYNDTQLILSVIEPEDEGLYECVISAADGGERRRRVRLRVDAPPGAAGRPTRLRADVDHEHACVRVTFRVPRSAGTPAAASRATYFLAYYPADGGAPLNNIAFNGAECRSVAADGTAEATQASSPKVVINGEIVSAADLVGLDLSDGGASSLPVDCQLSVCADQTNQNIEAGVVYVLHVSMLLGSERLAITRLSPPTTVRTWDAVASRALPLDMAYSSADRQLVIRWETPTTDEIRGQITGFDLAVVDDRLNGRAAWTNVLLNASVREYRISVGEAAAPFTYRLRVVPLTRTGALPKSHIESASNFAFVFADAPLFGDGAPPADAPPHAFVVRQSALGAARLRVSWNESQRSAGRQVIVRYAEVRRLSKQRNVVDSWRLARMRTRTAAAGDGALELTDGLIVGDIYQVCAAFQLIDQPMRGAFWRCARVSLLDESGRLARIAALPLPEAVRCNNDNCHCEYLAAEDVLRISWAKPTDTALETTVTDGDSNSNTSDAAYYIIHYKKDDSNINSSEHTVEFDVIDGPLTETSRNCALRAELHADLVDLPLACAPMPLRPAGSYRIAIESQNVDRVGTLGDFFACRLSADGPKWPAPLDFHVAAMGAPDSGQRRVSFAWSAPDTAGGSSLNGYTIFVQAENGTSAGDEPTNSTTAGSTVKPLRGAQIKSYFVPGADSHHFDLFQDNSPADATRLRVWIEARPSGNGRAVASAPIVVDLNLAPFAADGPPFWRRRAFFVGTAALLFGVALIVCGASVCILAQIRLTERWEKRMFDEENAEIEREFFGVPDDIPLAERVRTTSYDNGGWLTRFRRVVRSNNQPKGPTIVAPVDSASLSSSPLVPRRGIHDDVLFEDHDDSISLAASQASQVEPIVSLVSRSIPTELRDQRDSQCDSKGGAHGCEPAGSRRFRQRLQEDLEFKRACLAAVRQQRSAGRQPSAATTTSLSLAQLSRWRVGRRRSSRRTASCDIDTLPATVAAAVPLIAGPFGRRMDRNAMQTVIIEMADLSATEPILSTVVAGEKYVVSKPGTVSDENPATVCNDKRIIPNTDSSHLTHDTAVINLKNDGIITDNTNPTTTVAKAEEKQLYNDLTTPTVAESAEIPFSDDLPTNLLTTDAATATAERLAPVIVDEALHAAAVDALAERLVVDALRSVLQVDGYSNEAQTEKPNTLDLSDTDSPELDKQPLPEVTVGAVAPPAMPITVSNGIASGDALLYQNGARIVAKSDCNQNGSTTTTTAATVSVGQEVNGFHDVTVKKDKNYSNIEYRINDDTNAALNNNNNNDNYSINGYKSRTKCNGQPTRRVHSNSSNNNNEHNYYGPKNNKRNNKFRHHNNSNNNHNNNFHAAGGCAPPAAVTPSFRAAAAGEP